LFGDGITRLLTVVRGVVDGSGKCGKSHGKGGAKHNPNVNSE
jgi:hypothetical protein